MKNKVVFDLETTGVNTSTDRIVEISMVKTDKKFKIIDKYYKIINPTIPIPEGASNVHGITDERVSNAPTFAQVAKEIHSFIKDCDLGGFNSDRFDIPLLIEEFKRVGVVFNIDSVSTIDAYKIEIKGFKNTLSDVYKRHTGKDLEGAHGADADVMATIEILKSQIKNLGLPEEFSDIEDYLLEGNPRLDLGGRLKYSEGVVCWGFGKHINKPVASEPSYIRWCLGSEFPEDFKDIIRKYL